MTTKVFQLIDLDRTIFDTATFAKALTDKINAIHPGLGTELDARFEESYKKEETFFLLRYLRQTQGDDWFEQLVADVVHQKGANAFLLPGASERLAAADSLSDLRPSWGMLTYGDDVDQLMKLRIIGLVQAPVYLTDTADKAEVIRSWQQPDGTFLLPGAFGGMAADTLTFEDDKLRAFVNLPENVKGIWITGYDDATARLSEAGLTGNVTVAKNLHESLAYLQQMVGCEISYTK